MPVRIYQKLNAVFILLFTFFYLCSYPSGNSAVVVLSPYAGVLSYMVYEVRILCSKIQYTVDCH